MQFLGPIGFEVFLVAHIISVMIAIGAVTVTDYLHVVGLRDKRVEKKLLFVYGLLGRVIHAAVVGIIITGLVLVIHKPELLSSSIFQLKMALFAIALINGFYLNKMVFPEMDACVRLGKAHCDLNILFKSSLSGSISVVTWYTILILVLTKHYDHSIPMVLLLYVSAILGAFTVALFMESRARKWNA